MERRKSKISKGLQTRNQNEQFDGYNNEVAYMNYQNPKKKKKSNLKKPKITYQAELSTQWDSAQNFPPTTQPKCQCCPSQVLEEDYNSNCCVCQTPANLETEPCHCCIQLQNPSVCKCNVRNVQEIDFEPEVLPEESERNLFEPVKPPTPLSSPTASCNCCSSSTFQGFDSNVKCCECHPPENLQIEGCRCCIKLQNPSVCKCNAGMQEFEPVQNFPGSPPPTSPPISQTKCQCCPTPSTAPGEDFDTECCQCRPLETESCSCCIKLQNPSVCKCKRQVDDPIIDHSQTHHFEQDPIIDLPSSPHYCCERPAAPSRFPKFPFRRCFNNNKAPFFFNFPGLPRPCKCKGRAPKNKRASKCCCCSKSKESTKLPQVFCYEEAQGNFIPSEYPPVYQHRRRESPAYYAEDNMRPYGGSYHSYNGEDRNVNPDVQGHQFRREWYR